MVSVVFVDEIDAVLVEVLYFMDCPPFIKTTHPPASPQTSIISPTEDVDGIVRSTFNPELTIYPVLDTIVVFVVTTFHVKPVEPDEEIFRVAVEPETENEEVIPTPGLVVKDTIGPVVEPESPFI